MKNKIKRRGKKGKKGEKEFAKIPNKKREFLLF